MAQTVIGFFDNYSEAQEAVQRLQSRGISRDSIDISSANSGTEEVTHHHRSDDDDRDHENGITRFFKSLFGDDDDEADRYSRVAQRSGGIITVQAQSSEEAESIADILDDSGAINVEEKAAGYGYRSATSSDTGERADITGEAETSVPRIEEHLEVGKRTVETGGVRVRSRIVERPVEETVRLREENVRVERTPVDRPVAGNELADFRERDIELTERAEVPVVNKEARVVEEVRLSKDVREREETIRDSVRNTEVDVENIDRNDARYRDVNDSTRSSDRTRNFDEPDADTTGRPTL